MMFFLPWWTYVLIGTVAFVCSFGAVWLANIAQPGVEQPDDGPFPCFAWLGHDGDGLEMWCWLRHGHSGRHEDQSELPDTAFTRECHGASEDEHRTLLDDGEDLEYISPGVYKILPPLPQRLSKVPAQTEHTPSQPWPGCEHQSSDGRCRLVKSHIGPHEYL